MLANGLVPTILAITYSFATGGPEYLLGVANAFETPLAAAFIGRVERHCHRTRAQTPRAFNNVSESVPTTMTPRKASFNGGVNANE